MLSRIAESLFWIGRYIERADGTARIVDVLRLQLLEDPAAQEGEASRTVLSVIMGMPSDGAVGFTDVGDRLVFDRQNPSAIAGALSAQKLIFLTDVEGILKDKDDPSTIIRTLTHGEAVSYIEQGIIKGGMIPKVQCCLDGLEKGVESVHVLDGRLPHAILLEIFTTRGIGTMVTKEKTP